MIKISDLKPALLAAMAGLLLTMLMGIFALYRNPLLEIYLSSWALC